MDARARALVHLALKASAFGVHKRESDNVAANRPQMLISHKYIYQLCCIIEWNAVWNSTPHHPLLGPANGILTLLRRCRTKLVRRRNNTQWNRGSHLLYQRSQWHFRWIQVAIVCFNGSFTLHGRAGQSNRSLAFRWNFGRYSPLMKHFRYWQFYRFFYVCLSLLLSNGGLSIDI